MTKRATRQVLVLASLFAALAAPWRSAAESVADGGAPTQHHHHHEVPPVATPAATDSLFVLQSVFHDEEGKPFRFSQLRGSPALVVMFYGSCKTMCPVLIEDARDIDAALSDAQRKQLRVVLVTLDPARDTPERLRALARERKLERPRWTLLRGSDRDVRELSMVLGVQYRRLSGGDYSHTALLTLLDRDGRIAARIEGLRQPNGVLVAALTRMLSSSPKQAEKAK